MGPNTAQTSGDISKDTGYRNMSECRYGTIHSHATSRIHTILLYLHPTLLTGGEALGKYDYRVGALQAVPDFRYLRRDNTDIQNTE